LTVNQFCLFTYLQCNRKYPFVMLVNSVMASVNII